MKDLLLDILDFFKYDILKKNPPEPNNLHLELDFVLHKDGKGMWAEAKEYPGLVASGSTPEELRKALWDSILTYFDVPRAYAKRKKDKLRLNLPNGTIIEPKMPFWEREFVIKVAAT
jgi:ABC-type Fe3+ transport system substrate-binding protein